MFNFIHLHVVVTVFWLNQLAPNFFTPWKTILAASPVKLEPTVDPPIMFA